MISSDDFHAYLKKGNAHKAVLYFFLTLYFKSSYV